MTLRIITPPESEPVTLAEAKAHLRLEESLDDAFVTALISTARQHIEKVCWRGLIQQTVELELPGFRGSDKLEQMPDYVAGTPEPYPYQSNRFQPFIELKGGQLATTPSLTVTYLDVNGASQTLDSSNYLVQSFDNELGRLWLNTAGGYSWPSTLERFDAVKVRYKVGWATAAAVPAPLKSAILLLISQMYEYRSPQIERALSHVAFSVDALITPYRLVRL